MCWKSLLTTLLKVYLWSRGVTRCVSTRCVSIKQVHLKLKPKVNYCSAYIRKFNAFCMCSMLLLKTINTEITIQDSLLHKDTTLFFDLGVLYEMIQHLFSLQKSHQCPNGCTLHLAGLYWLPWMGGPNTQKWGHKAMYRMALFLGRAQS